MQAVKLSHKEGHNKEALAAVAMLNQLFLEREQHKEEVMQGGECTTVTADGGLLSTHLQPNTQKPAAVDKHLPAGRLHQHAAGSAEVPRTADGSREGNSLQPAQREESGHRPRDKAEADRDKHQDRSHDSSRPSSGDTAREHHRHQRNEHRSHKSSHRHDRPTHRHHEDSTDMHGEHYKQSSFKNQDRLTANLSSHAKDYRPSSSSLPISRVASKDDKRHWHSSDHSRPRSGSHDRRRSRSPREHSNHRWVHQKR